MRHERLELALKSLPEDYSPWGEKNYEVICVDCSSGCIHFIPLHVEKGDYKNFPDYEGVDLDWGVCVNPKSHRCGLLTFEHQGCEHFEETKGD